MLRITLLSLCAALAALPAQAAPGDFSCRNTAAEVRCTAGACELAEPGGFTPMSLTRTGDTLEICAYSGCAPGRILMRRTVGGMVQLSARVRFNGTGPASTLAVIYDPTAKIALMRWDAFANPMDCGDNANN